MDKAVKAKRELCVQRMSEIHAVALKASSDEVERAILLECYVDVDRIAQDFEAMHLKIIQDGSSEFKTEDEIRAKFDKARYQIKSIYRKYAPSTVVPRGTTPTSNFKLPKILIPPFSGELALWPSFFALFNTSIHNNSLLTNTEKFQYLISLLSDDALSAISNLPLSDDNYPIAYDTLVSRYKNKRKLASLYWNSIAGAKQLKVDSAESLGKLLDTFNENLRALELMEFPVNLKDFILLNVLLGKLTPSLREKFEVEHRKTEIPRFKQLVKFLNEYCRVFASLSIEPPPKKSSDKPSKNFSAKSSTTSTFVTNEVSCLQCNQSHLLVKCPAFLKLTEKDRHAKARQLRLCLNCLKAGHRASSCPSQWRCRKCNELHHSLLHFAPKGDSSAQKETHAPSSTKNIASSNVTTASSSEASVISMTTISRSNSVVLLSTVQAEMADASGHFFPVRVLLDSASQSNFVTEGCVQRSGLTRTPCRSIVLGINDTKAANTKGRTSLVLRVKSRIDLRLPLEATILTKISSPLPNLRAKL
ncbi:unnamed protein product [Lasius platythorax]|uniref:CCHC-type domain-containing protein n=1 Tax=Lasius platythorax TaxID=488582 RepID=A0AAV2NNC0_9HYME